MNINNNMLSKQRQQGATLIVSLIILMVLTLIGVSSMNTTMQEEKMAGNLREQQTAFQCAEAAMMDTVEQVADGNIVFEDFNGGNGFLREADDEPTDYFNPNLWNNANSSVVRTGLSTIDSELQPRYIIRVLGVIGEEDIDPSESADGDGRYGNVQTFIEMRGYRLTVRCTGASGTAVSIIQGHYGI